VRSGPLRVSRPTRLVLLLIGALGLALIGLGTGCADEENFDSFRRIAANERQLFVLNPRGLIQEVIQLRELRDQPATTDHPVYSDGLGALVSDALWYSDGTGVARLEPESSTPEDYVSVERLLGLSDADVAFWEITSIDSFRNLLWIGLAESTIPDESGQGGEEAAMSRLVALDVNDLTVRHSLAIDSPVNDAVILEDRLVLLTGERLFGGGGVPRIEIRSAVDGLRLAATETGLESVSQFDRLSNGHAALWLATGISKAIRRIDPKTGRPTRVIAVPCTPEVVLPTPSGLIVACFDRPTLLFQPRAGGEPNELPLQGEVAVDIQSSAGALWIVQADGRLSRIQEQDLPWPN
jgi:hypothetical protein